MENLTDNQQPEQELPIVSTDESIDIESRIFSRETPVFDLPNTGLPWLYDDTPVRTYDIKSNIINPDLSIITDTDFIFSYNTIVKNLFSNYPNIKIPEEKVTDLNIDEYTSSLLSQNRDFADAMLFIFNNEGGYKEWEDSLGGKTKFGISQKYNQDLNVSSLTINQALQRYYQNYWNSDSVIDRINYKPLQMIYFDDVVLSGIGGAHEIIENFVKDNFKTDDFEDGMRYMDIYMSKGETSDLIELYEAYNQHRKNHYLGKKNKKVVDGWINRVNKATDFINKYYYTSWEL